MHYALQFSAQEFGSFFGTGGLHYARGKEGEEASKGEEREEDER